MFRDEDLGSIERVPNSAMLAIECARKMLEYLVKENIPDEARTPGTPDIVLTRTAFANYATDEGSFATKRFKVDCAGVDPLGQMYDAVAWVTLTKYINLDYWEINHSGHYISVDDSPPKSLQIDRYGSRYSPEVLREIPPEIGLTTIDFSRLS